MNKKGFTLVELMVVIIVMGLLAAIAVPKLFGMIAKSRASEVQPAAAAYVKLQKAFIAEKGGVGTWKSIGYAAPGKRTKSETAETYNTDYFAYGGSDIQIGSTIKPKFTETLGEGKIGWVAENLSSLNDCAAGNKWVVTVYPVNDTTVEYRLVSKFASNCSMLVSNWNQSDYGVTYMDSEFEDAKLVEGPEDIALSSATSSSSTTSSSSFDATAAACIGNGSFLDGKKNGWEKPSSKHYPCYLLKMQFFAASILECTQTANGNGQGHTKGEGSKEFEACLHFGFTDYGKSEVCKNYKKYCDESSNTSTTSSASTSTSSSSSVNSNPSSSTTGSGSGGTPVTNSSSSVSSSSVASSSSVEPLSVSCPGDQTKKSDGKPFGPLYVGSASGCENGNCSWTITRSGGGESSYTTGSGNNSEGADFHFTDTASRYNNTSYTYKIKVKRGSGGQNNEDDCSFIIKFKNNP